MQEFSPLPWWHISYNHIKKLILGGPQMMKQQQEKLTLLIVAVVIHSFRMMEQQFKVVS